MKLKTILFSAFMLTTFFMMAQDWSSDVYRYGELYPGYIIDLEGKKTEGFIKYQDRVTMQNGIQFFTEKDNKKSKLKVNVEDLTEYKVADKVYHVIHYSGGLFSKPLKGNLLVKDGCIKQYVWYEKSEEFATMQRFPNETDEEFDARRYVSTVLFKKDGIEEVQSETKMGLGFAKDMPEWLADQPELAQKVANKENGYRFINMHAVVEEYNANCEQ